MLDKKIEVADKTLSHIGQICNSDNNNNIACNNVIICVICDLKIFTNILAVFYQSHENEI